MSYRMRLRVRLGKPLTSDELSILMKIEGREVKVCSQSKDEPLRSATWVILEAKGFPTEDQAKSFGDRLRAQVELAALSARLGVDTGDDQPTTWVNEDWARQMGIIGKDERIVPNVHGLSVLPDSDGIRFPIANAKGTVTADPNQLLHAIEELSEKGLCNLAEATGVVRLLNSALLSNESLARAVLAFSAVEALGQSEQWSEYQKEKIKSLALQVRDESSSSNFELLEIADALQRSLHRIGLRQGVMRLLNRLNLEILRDEWDRLYSVRSGIFHGTKVVSEAEGSQFSHDVFTLCAKIVLAYAKAQGVHIPSVASKHFS